MSEGQSFVFDFATMEFHDAPPARTLKEDIDRALWGYPIDKLLVGLENIQRTLCSYDNFGCDPARRPPRKCDCKYGANEEPKNIGKGHEYACGCCELRTAIEIVKAALEHAK